MLNSLRAARVATFFCAFALPFSIAHADDPTFEPMDVFALEWVSQIDLSPDGETLAYTRAGFDLKRDNGTAHIWLSDVNGANPRPLTGKSGFSPTFSPDGKRIAFMAGGEAGVQVYMHWLEANRTSVLTQLTQAPAGLSWSPDGKWLAFTMIVPSQQEPFAKLPKPPEGATWAKPAQVIDQLTYRADGRGYLKPGYSHLFVLPADGGTPRQITSGNYHHAGGFAWKSDGSGLYVSANRREDAQYETRDTDIFEVSLAGDHITQLTKRYGPDFDPRLSPDGRYLALRGFDDDLMSYNQNRISIIDLEDGGRRTLAGDLDRSVNAVRWRDTKSLYIAYDDSGIGRIDTLTLTGKRRRLVDDFGGLSLSRPYSGGTLDAEGTTLAYSLASTSAPAELAVLRRGALRRITDLNEDILGHTNLARIETIRFASMADGREIEAWVAFPPDFDTEKRYPAILEIHGGPFTAYGPHFAAEVQLYAAAGYVVVYANPRGSTSYGYEFANLIHHNYPGDDYHDLMSAVDHVIDRGWADPERLYVTGGSGGGILTAWIVTRTDRFRAAVSAKPVINWTSFVLTADMYGFFSRYWFAELPWNDPESYRIRSPISFVGNVSTPTMLLTGEVDYRTPISESEQFYQALKLARVDTALVRIPGASHSIASRPSHLISKVAHILAWFERYAPAAETNVDTEGSRAQ